MARLRVMLVDDHQIIREGIKALLADVPGIDFVTEADNGEDALAKYEIYDVDLVIMDVQMPELDGVEATKQLMKDFPDAKVLGFTMHTEEATIGDMIKAGALGYVLKNSGKEELLQAMEKVSKGEYYFSSDVSEKLLNELVKKYQNKKS